MGVELTLLITTGSPEFAHQQLSMPYDSEMFEALENKLISCGFDCPRIGVSCFCAIDQNGYTRYGKLIHDRYGNKLQSLTPKQIIEVMKAFPSSDWEYMAVLSYLKHLPESIIIYLFWN